MMSLRGKFITTIFILFFSFILSSCSTLHTGPLLLGDIPLPFGRMKEGQIYRDPKNRFEVLCPAPDSTVGHGKYGVTFSFMEDEINYHVFAYDTPPELPNSILTIDNAFKGIKLIYKQKGFDLEVVREENLEYKGHESRNFDFVWKPKDKNTVPRIYVTRFVKTDNFVYWLNYSIADWSRKVVIEQYNLDNAEKFFDRVKFEKEF